MQIYVIYYLKITWLLIKIFISYCSKNQNIIDS